MQLPTRRDADWRARAVWVAPASQFAEDFRHLAQRVRGRLGGEGSRSVLVTSALPGEGKTVAACNLALALRALAPREKVALVDLDLRVPGVANALGIEPETGVEEVLRGSASIEAACVETDAGVDVFPVLASHTAAYELLARPELSELIRKLEATYRWIIFDSAPLLAVADVGMVLDQVDTCLAVVRAGRTPKAALHELAERLPREKLLGFFLNDGRRPGHGRYHRSSYYEQQSSRSWWKRGSR
jgi:Mrp family chromosome partitioning ATPase